MKPPIGTLRVTNPVRQSRASSRKRVVPTCTSPTAERSGVPDRRAARLESFQVRKLCRTRRERVGPHGNESNFRNSTDILGSDAIDEPRGCRRCPPHVAATAVSMLPVVKNPTASLGDRGNRCSLTFLDPEPTSERKPEQHANRNEPAYS